MPDWQAEDIPDRDHLFMRVHIRTFARGGILSAGAFKNHGRGMSTDWDKYSTAVETRARGPNPPDEYWVVRMNVGEVRGVPGQTVEHSPLPENRAHTDVIGEKDEEARVKLRRLSVRVIPPLENTATD